MEFEIGDRVTYGWADCGPMRRSPQSGRIVGWQERVNEAGELIEPVYWVHADDNCPGTPPYRRTASELQPEVK